MLHKIIAWSVTNKLIVGFFTLLLIIVGIFSLSRLPIDAVPDITNNQVQIITSSPSSGALDVERYVTFPVEQSMATIPEMEEIRSFSRFGLSVVTVVFNENTDVYWARQQVLERLADAKGLIPKGFGEPYLAPLSSGLGEIYQYTIRAKKGYESKYNPTELRTIQDWIIRRQLLGVKGVADVSGFGGNLKNYEIALDPIALQTLNLSIEDVFTALENNNQNSGGAYIERNGMATFIRTEGLLQTEEEIKSIVLKTDDLGTNITIDNVATVKIGSSVRYGALTIDNQGEAVGGIVMMLKGANSSEVISLVKERIEQIKKTLPKGIELVPYLDRTDLVNRAIHTVEKNLLEGALIVIFVLVLVLGNFRAGLIVASVIPLAMLFAISLMQFFGVSGNLMSLGALDFGLIIDGAVIIVESTLHLMHRFGNKTLTQQEMDDEVTYSASKFSNSAVFGQIIILVVYLPILVLVGIEGKMFRPMAQTVMFAIIGALILSLTYVPMVSSLFLSKKLSHKETISDKLVNAVKRAYLPLLHQTIKHRNFVLSGLFAVLIFAFWLFGNLGAEFIPNLDEGDFAVETRLVTGSGLTKTIEVSEKAGDVLLKRFPEVKQVVGKIGTAEIPTDPMPMEACDLMIILKDKEEWTSAHSKDELAEKMQQVLEEQIPGVSFGFQQPIQMRFNELMTGAKQDVVVKIYGEQFDKLGNYARKIGQLAGKISGVQDVYVEEMEGLPQLIVRPNFQALGRYGIDVATLNTTLNTALAGKSAGLVFEGEKRFELVVRLQEGYRSTVDKIDELVVVNKNGMAIPITELAEISLENGPNQIQREDAKRRILVGFNVRGRDVESIVNELKKQIDAQIQFDSGYFVTYGGTFKNLENARQRLLVAVPAALFLIFMLLYFAFSSLKQAVLIFSAIPFAAIGGIFALALRDMPFSISAGVGFIALFGVAVLNGIVLIAEFNNLKKGTNLSNIRRVFNGAGSRLRPVLMTALVASLGFVPMAISSGSGAEVQKPLATVVIGGLISSTFLTLFILPILYLFSESKRKKSMKKSKLTLLLLALFMGFSSSSMIHAQTLSYPELCNLMLANNGNLKALSLEKERQLAVSKGNIEWGKTNAMWMFGQYNTIQMDHNLTFSQQIPFPTVATAEKQLGKVNAQQAENWKEIELLSAKLSLKQYYDQVQFLQEKRAYLNDQDSILKLLYDKMTLRKEVQDITKLELSLVNSRLKKVRNDYSIIDNEILQVLEIISALVGKKIEVNQIPKEAYSNMNSNLSLADLENHPNLRIFETREEQLKAEKAVNLQRQLPDLSFGYFNQSLVGIQNINGTDQYFDANKRFQGGQFGVSIPLFWGAYNQRKNALDIAIDQNALAGEQQLRNLEGSYQKTLRRMESLLKTRDLYLNQLLPESKLMQEENELHFAAGEHSMIEYLQIRDQVKQIEMDALNNLFDLHQTLIQIEFFTNKLNQK